MNEYTSWKIAVIGGRGFIGSKILDRAKIDHTNVLSIDKEDCDISQEKNISRLYTKLKMNDINTVVSLAATKRQDGDSKEIYNINNSITKNICKALQQINCKVIYYSSCAVYGEKNEQANINEESELSPTSYYGEHKALSEEIYQQEIKSNNLLIIRPPLIYSWKQKLGYHPGGFLASARENAAIYLWGDGKEKREFIHINDASEITNLLIKKGCSGKVIMASGKSYSYISIAEKIKEMQNCQIIERQRTGQKVDHSYNNTRLMEKIGKYIFRSPYPS